MIHWLKNLFKSKPNTGDMVQFVRTEYAKDTRHMRDEDCLAFYNSFFKNRRL